MARRKRARKVGRPIESYDHRNQGRLNNPPVGLVTPETDQGEAIKRYAYDPHLDPQLQWSGKDERSSFDTHTVSLHVHERIDPRTAIEAVRRRESNGGHLHVQGNLFELPEENLPIRHAIEFYEHEQNWTNRLVAGDSLLVMNSLLQKESMAGQVQMVYLDPPYGIRYGSNFQPFVNRQRVRDGNEEDLTHEPETIKAFRDTWELGIHSYLSYLRDRLLLARDLLTESGSVFVQISDENLHHVREILDEVFGVQNFISVIPIRKTTSQGTAKLLGSTTDFIVWYARNAKSTKYRQLYLPRSETADDRYDQALLEDGTVIPARKVVDHTNSQFRRFTLSDLTSSGPAGTGDVKEFEFEGKRYTPGRGTFKTNFEGLTRLANARRIQATSGGTLRYRRFKADFPVAAIGNLWNDISGAVQSRSDPKIFAVQTSTQVIERCMLMATDPGDLVLDPTCGSGTTAYVAEKWGRRWITCDTSRVAITLAKQRLLTGLFDYYELKHPSEGVGSGFNYNTVPHITLGSIANNLEIVEGMSQKEIDRAIARNAPQETLYDQPVADPDKRRVAGPFCVEAVPAPVVAPIDEVALPPILPADGSVSRAGETSRQADWRDELARTGIRGKGGQYIRFSQIEPLAGVSNLHADGEGFYTRGSPRNADRGEESESRRIVISFGPAHAPLEQRQVSRALEETLRLVPQPRIIVFAAFQFDPEAAKDIDETNWPEMTLLKVQMNPDLLTEDLKRRRASNESFWLVGQPDVQLFESRDGDAVGEWRVRVDGFDYYNTRTGNVESGSGNQIAMWMLDPDYDGRSLYPRQIFFPMAGPNDGWGRLARSLQAELNIDLIENFRGIDSLPFPAGSHSRIAVKIVDDRGIESLKVIDLELPGNQHPIGKQKKTSLDDILDDSFRDVPKREWDRLPKDLVGNLDHYLYGTEKQ